MSCSSLIRWLETSTARPCAASDRRNPRIHTMPSGSMPLNGSSIMSTGGSPSIAAAIPSRCRMPREYPPAFRRAAVLQAGLLDHLVDPAGASGPGSGPATAGGCGRSGWAAARPRPAATRRGSAGAAGSRTAARRPARCPRRRASRPRITRIVVDLPAPFGPTNPVTWPGGTVNDHPVQRQRRPEPLAQAGDFDRCFHGANARARRPARSSRRGAVLAVHWHEGHRPGIPPERDGRLSRAGVTPAARREATMICMGTRVMGGVSD